MINLPEIILIAVLFGWLLTVGIAECISGYYSHKHFTGDLSDPRHMEYWRKQDDWNERAAGIFLIPILLGFLLVPVGMVVMLIAMIIIGGWA